MLTLVYSRMRPAGHLDPRAQLIQAVLLAVLRKRPGLHLPLTVTLHDTREALLLNPQLQIVHIF